MQHAPKQVRDPEEGRTSGRYSVLTPFLHVLAGARSSSKENRNEPATLRAAQVIPQLAKPFFERESFRAIASFDGFSDQPV
jgi:hypothetical protein